MYKLLESLPGGQRHTEFQILAAVEAAVISSNDPLEAQEAGERPIDFIVVMAVQLLRG